MADPVSAHLLPGLDWLVKLGIGLIVAAAGVLLIRPPRRGARRFALGIFTIEAGALVAIRGIVAGGGSSWWQYLMPFALVLVPGIFIAVVLTRLRWLASQSLPVAEVRSALTQAVQPDPWRSRRTGET